MEIIFVHLLGVEDKGFALLEAASEISKGNATPTVLVLEDMLFTSIPGCPLAYHAPPQMLLLAAKGQTLAANGVIARQGIGASTRFHRLVWEVPYTGINRDWLYMAHGTPPARFYKPTTHLFLWADDGREAKAEVVHRYPYLNGNYGFKIQAEEFYRKPGLCYGKRTEDFTVQVLPADHVFSFEGTAIFTDGTYLDAWALLGLLNSSAVGHWLSAVCAEHKAYNYIESTPVPLSIGESGSVLQELAKEGWHFRRCLDLSNVTSPVFMTIALVHHNGETLASTAQKYAVHVGRINEALSRIRDEIDDIVFALYDIPARLGRPGSPGEAAIDRERPEYDDQVAEEPWSAPASDILALTCQLLDYVLGIAFGRWDVRIAVEPSRAPSLPDALSPLPACPPGMLQNTQGMPATPEDAPTDYPLRISWEGILVDDPDHREDIVRRAREALRVIWKERDEAIEQEACEILGVRSLRDYFAAPGQFFPDHLKRYSKSRRQAPIYWPLSTSSGRYTVWLYYHRLTQDTLYTVVNRYVEPKLDDVERRLEQLEARLASTTGRAAAQLRDEMADLRGFADELHDFRAELLRVAALPYKPDLNDGVIINAAPLHKLFRLRKWAQATEAVWKKLESGEYDWAHMAYVIWPDRVRKKCETDRSIAIAHGLEGLCRTPSPKGNRSDMQQAPDEGDTGLEESDE